MNAGDLILSVVTILNLILGLIIFTKDRRNKINIFFTLFALSIAWWSVAILMFRYVQSSYWALWWIKVSYFAAVFIACTFWSFTTFFPDNRPMSKGRKWLLWLSTVFIIALLLLPTSLTKSVIFYPWGKEVMLGIMEYSIFGVYFVAFFFGALFLLSLKHKEEKRKLVRSQLLNIFLGVFIPGTVGVITNLILPSPLFNNWHWIWVGPVVTFLNVLFVSLAIARFQLMNIKVIATEFLTSLIIIVIAVETFFANSTSEIFFRIIFLGLISFFGVLLIRGVKLEISRREEIQKLAVDLKTANEKLVELDRAKSEFLSIAAHQLRTPLSVIKGYVSLLLDGDYGKICNSKMHGVLDNIYKTNEHLVHLVDDFLSLARLESGRIEYSFKDIDLAEVVSQAVEEFGEKVKEKDLKLVLKIQKKLPKIWADAEKVHNVVFNFIDNAIKYSNQGTLVVKLEKEDCVINCSVEDNGIGMSKVDLENIFQKFYRGKNVTGLEVGGTGLGLYVCRRFIEAHNGRIWARSRGKGKGSIFGFTLPIACKTHLT
jgi:signal transduction histidine kinase